MSPIFLTTEITTGMGFVTVPAPAAKAGDKVLAVINTSSSPPADITIDFGSFIPGDGFIAQIANVTSIVNCIVSLQRG